ncbi:hypothetical protein JT06_02485 [Desulfobulbus sp. Tol-SR]|nr:hypothetical protein JT06_02485 [Desulfobulbus sp. Tol-SR]
MTSLYELPPDIARKIRNPKWLDFGKPRDFWTMHVKLIGEMMKKYGLIPAESVDLPLRQDMEAMEMRAATGNKERTIWPRPFPGGMLIPHFHYKGEVYLVPEKEWRKISHNIKEIFVKKLSDANRLSFDQTMTLSETIDSIRGLRAETGFASTGQQR